MFILDKYLIPSLLLGWNYRLYRFKNHSNLETECNLLQKRHRLGILHKGKEKFRIVAGKTSAFSSPLSKGMKPLLNKGASVKYQLFTTCTPAYIINIRYFLSLSEYLSQQLLGGIFSTNAFRLMDDLITAAASHAREHKFHGSRLG